ncbi:MAG: CBS domain-containing protein [Ktedonobacterales bacterium]|nr:CBS domain-containing protein [Ktedonobacterales bacterium]
MPTLAELLDKPIRDPDGDEFARVRDLVVRVGLPDKAGRNGVETYPPVTGLVARLKSPRGVRDVFIPWNQVRSLGVEGAQLNTPAVNLERFARREGEIVLRDALFDRQVVDVEGHRVIRINDLDLAKRNGVYRLVAVDASPGALLRRLGWGRLGRRVGNGPLIDWAQVVPIAYDSEGGTGALQLRVPRNRLDLLKPADLARVIEQLTPQQGADLLETMDEARAADTLEELEDEQQGQILRAMDPERAADVLEEMEPDEAADALQSVTTEEAADLLKRMDREEAGEVRELLGYPEDSAGGIMTTEYVSVPEWATSGEIISALRARAQAAAAETDDPLPDTLLEIYVVSGDGPNQSAPPQRPEAAARRTTRPRPATPLTPLMPQAIPLSAEGRLLGRVSLRDLLLSEPEARVGSTARPVPHPAQPLDNERDVARLIADDDLVALPVVDEHGLLLGIVTVDDAMDVILPTAWKKRIPRLFH